MLADDLLTRGPEGPDREARHPERQNRGGNDDHPGAARVRGGRYAREEESQEGEEHALSAALRRPGHELSLLFGLLLVVFLVGRFGVGVFAVVERLVGHARVMPERARLQSKAGPGA